MLCVSLVTLLCALVGVAAQKVEVDANAFNDTTQLNPPPLPNPLPPLSFDIPSASTPAGLGVVQDSLLGFSLEVSVSASLFGKSKSELNPIFVRLLSHVAQRAGHVKIRVGGNSQEGSVIVEPNAIDGLVQKEEDVNTVNPTDTPNILVSRDIIDMMSQISTKTNAGWYVGIPFNDTNFRLRVAELAQQTLGDNLLGMQLGNEPDLYGRHRRRDPATWTTQKYFEEFGWGVKAIQDNPNISAKNKIVGPSIALTEWTPEQLWETGYIEAYKDSLGTLAVERYPGSNCGAIKGLGQVIDPQKEIVVQMSHKSAQSYVAPYHNTAALAQQAGKPFVVMEFNTGTCSGFPGLSNAFGAALWIIDASLQMAHSNFSGAMLHVGGQNAFYNPFTPPPGALIRSHGWTVGPPYYAHLVVGEAIGSTNRSRVIDLNANGGNEYTPAYGVYEDGTPEAQRVVLLNFMTDGSGKADYTASVAVPGDRESVKVKYLLADSTAARSNFTWAGQTFGGVFESDGRPKGDVRIETILCNAGKCPVKVPAPAVAVVFLSDKALAASDPGLSAAAGTGNAGANQSEGQSGRGNENAAPSQYSNSIQLAITSFMIFVLCII